MACIQAEPAKLQPIWQHGRGAIHCRASYRPVNKQTLAPPERVPRHSPQTPACLYMCAPRSPAATALRQLLSPRGLTSGEGLRQLRTPAQAAAAFNDVVSNDRARSKVEATRKRETLILKQGLTVTLPPTMSPTRSPAQVGAALRGGLSLACRLAAWI